MYTLKTIARRGTALGMAASLLVAAVMPGVAVFADALNPLTERSLLLSSSAPGFQNTDGSGNPTYAPAGSGPNGSMTGETFTFTVSTQSPPDVKGFSFQYCTVAAGLCRAPGNNNGSALTTNRELNSAAHANGRSDLDIVGTFAQAGFGAGGALAPAAGEFQILVDTGSGFDETTVDDWQMTTVNSEDAGWIDGGTPESDGLTGTKNYIAMHSPTGMSLDAGDKVQIIFKASNTAHITNPGKGSFFVKINTYNTDDYADSVSTDGDAGDGSNGYTQSWDLEDNTHVIDGGVTVANVMTDSIHIVTKVLETMSFSVGIQNPDTVNRGPGVQQHGRCEPMLQTNSLTGLTNNRLNLGNPNAEYSLETGTAWDVNSYWRLSSNSSGGATVYYSGDTLANTSGDHIADMQSEQVSNPGTEQFGLGFVDASLETFANAGGGDDTFASGWGVRSYPFKTVSTQAGATGIGTENYTSLAAQTESQGYDEATGAINGTPVAKFQFHASSNTIPEVIAQQDETVISCATAKMRYIGNIGADTPAGVYTTKVNYLAAPQY